MAKIELIMPKMGESIMEATILKWLKKPGDTVEQDETILEIATDKVDSEIPSPVSGIILETLYNEDDVVEIGKVIAYIGTEGEQAGGNSAPAENKTTPVESKPQSTIDSPKVMEAATEAAKPLTATANTNGAPVSSSADRFYSPLVKNMAKAEGINQATLDQIPGSGAGGRVTKQDMLSFIEGGSKAVTSESYSDTTPAVTKSETPKPATNNTPVSTPSFASTSGGDEIIEMDRMRKLIADHMVMSKQTSPHVTSFVEADVTNLVNWRNKNKNAFLKAYGEKITFTPIILEAVVKAIKDYPMINVTVKGTQIHVKKNINVGMAAALPSGNLIVPVIKNADLLNLAGITKSVNDLANRARANKLKPEEIQDGTFTVTNVGTFGNVMGTPIINQPQVAIMAAGAIKKKPAVLETEEGDVIAIRQMMFLSLSYDHRVVDGFLGGSFVRRVADYLENFDPKREI